MKKVLCLLLAAAMLMAFAAPVVATGGESALDIALSSVKIDVTELCGYTAREES